MRLELFPLWESVLTNKWWLCFNTSGNTITIWQHTNLSEKYQSCPWRYYVQLHSGASPHYMFHRPLGCNCSYCAAQLETETFERKQKITSQTRGRPRLYKNDVCFRCFITAPGMGLPPRAGTCFMTAPRRRRWRPWRRTGWQFNRTYFGLSFSLKKWLKFWLKIPTLINSSKMGNLHTCTVEFTGVKRET